MPRSSHRLPLTLTLAIVTLAALSFSHYAGAAQRTWVNTGGTDFNTAADWNAATVPSGSNVAFFNAAEVSQPNLSASLSFSGILFGGTGTTGYDITRTGAATFTLNGVGSTGSSGSTDSTAAPLRGENTSGSNTIDAPIILGAATAASQTFFQAAGGTLIVNGAVSSTNAITLDFKGGGTIQLNAANTFTNGSTTLTDSGTTIQLGNDSALGTGTFTFGISSVLQAGGGSRTIANNINFSSGTPTFGGANNITLNGNLTNSGAANRTITINNSASTTFGGSLFLAGDNTTARIDTVNGTGDLTVSGVVANNNAGNTTASALTKSGTNTVTLTNTNTYTGATSVGNGSLIVNGSTTSASTVSVTATGILGGIGMIGGATTVGSGSIVAANGNITGATNGTIGTLNLGSSLAFNGGTGFLATYLVDIGGATSDKLAITGALDLSGTFDQISFNNLGALTATSYTLATATGGVTGTFDSQVNVPLGYQVDYTSNSVLLDQIAEVPEPGTWMAGALVTLGLIATQRRRFLKPASVRA